MKLTEKERKDLNPNPTLNESSPLFFSAHTILNLNRYKQKSKFPSKPKLNPLNHPETPSKAE
jgi:hypothetical protein